MIKKIEDFLNGKFGTWKRDPVDFKLKDDA